jgi:type I restriction enzyme M protein
MNNHSELVSFLWSIADLIRDTFKRGRYQDVILPFTVLRRIDAVLEPTKDKVLKARLKYKDKFDTPPDALLRRAAGYAFYNNPAFHNQVKGQQGMIEDDNVRTRSVGLRPRQFIVALAEH